MRRHTKPTTLPLGSISTGTLRPEDVIPELLDAADSVRMSAADRRKVRTLAAEWREWERANEDDIDHADTDLDPSEIWSDLEDVLNNYAPDYCYVGAHPGDGADIGVWLVEDAIDRAREDGALENEDVPRGYTGVVLDVNDHGNASLYRYVRGRNVRTIWSVV